MSAPVVPPILAPIVVADRGEAFGVLSTGLPPGLPLVSAGTVEKARGLITAATPLVLCDCHFDDGRMYELLRWMRTSDRLADVPFMAIRLRQGELDDAMYESVKIATSALGGDGFVDLYRLQLHYGAAEAGRRLTRRIEAMARGLDQPDDTVTVI